MAEYIEARHEEDVARLRRVPALRAMVATGMSQREIATALGVSQPAVSQQLRRASDLSSVHPEEVVDAAAPVLRRPTEDRARLGRRIDLVDYGGLKPRLDDDIRRKAVLL